MSIAMLTLIFGVVTLSGFAAIGVMVARRLPARMQAGLDRRLAEHVAATAALAEAYETADMEQRERLARNHRFHRAAALSLDPRAAAVELPSAKPRRARAA